MSSISEAVDGVCAVLRSRQSMRGETQSRTRTRTRTSQLTGLQNLSHFVNLQLLPGNFSNAHIVGEGGFGKVYKGQVKIGPECCN
ncbi:hypothetical protein F0562_020926 [Nyssa sinensis]|uniref:Protein kinase domain-containing protein n=1 Tax=Nyssa sinensis TaxID=561372 RepID=A0A5J5BVU3_9ASTE|nr:hypothetical protein F0562_020926 [Nyssa sinensis]